MAVVSLTESLDIIRSRFGRSATTSPATMYFAAVVVEPGDLMALVEPDDTAYVRIAVPNTTAWWGQTPGSVSIQNLQPVVWPRATTHWGAVVGIAIFDTLTGGAFRYYFPTFPAATVMQYDVYQIGVGDFVLASLVDPLAVVVPPVVDPVVLEVLSIDPVPVQDTMVAVAMTPITLTYTTQAVSSTVTLTVTGLPPGLTFNATTHVISGTPTTPDFYQPVVNASDNLSHFAVSVGIDWTVQSGVSIAPIPTQSWVVDAVGTDVAVTAASLTAGAVTVAATGMPPGVTFDPATNTFSGTPTAVGSSLVVITATDSAGHTAPPLVLDWFVTLPLAITIPLTQRVLRGAAIVPVVVEVVDVPGAVVTVAAAPRPVGVSFNATTKTFSGTPTTAGDTTTTITATDDAARTAAPVSFGWSVGLVAARFAGDPGPTNILVGANNGSGTVSTGKSMPIELFDSSVLNNGKRHVLVREYGSQLGISATDRAKIVKWHKAGRIPQYSIQHNGQNAGDPSYTLSDIYSGAAATDAVLQSSVDFFNTLPPTDYTWLCFDHEPEGAKGLTTPVLADAWRKATRYITTFFRTRNVVNVAFVGGHLVSDTYRSTTKDWREYHPNYIGSGVWETQSFVDMNGWDPYWPRLAAGFTADSRNKSWATGFAEYRTAIDQYKAVGPCDLPLCIGEFGIFNNLATLDDDGVTCAQILRDMAVFGPGEVVGVCAWDAGSAKFNDVYDPDGTKRAGWKAMTQMSSVLMAG